MTDKTFAPEILTKLRLSAIQFARNSYNCAKSDPSDTEIIQNIQILTGYNYKVSDFEKLNILNFLISILQKALLNENKQLSQEYSNFNRKIGLHQVLTALKKKRLSLTD